MQVSETERGAMASLKAHVAAVEQTNDELLAFARGHAGAVAAIHEAVLALLPADTLPRFAAVVTGDWPCLLGVDAVSFAWRDGARAIVANASGIRAVEPRLVARMAGIDRAVTARSVTQGHPLFGGDRGAIRAEVAVRLEGARGLGLLVLGQRGGAPVEAAAGDRLLRFLGRTCAAMLERWPLP